MKKAFILVLLIAASLTASYSQGKLDKGALGKEIKGRDIEWPDFVGEVDPTSHWNAYTDWVTMYRFSTPMVEGPLVRVRISVQLYLRPTSWVRPDKKSDELLEHERGHFNIGRICAKEIEQAIDMRPFSPSSYPEQIDDVYWEIIAKYKEFERQYDMDTKHYNDREQQALWNKKIAEMLKK
ncbi:MAG: DUF922 domain-containing protein [Pyrinomonadaceae bacterium]